MALRFVGVVYLLFFCLSCDDDKLYIGRDDGGIPPGGNADTTAGQAETRAKFKDLNQDEAIVKQVGKLFSLTVDLSDSSLASMSISRVRLVIEEGGEEILPEAVMMWHGPSWDREEWLNTTGTRVVAKPDLSATVANFEDIFLTQDLPDDSELVIQVLTDEAQVLDAGRHAIESEKGKYELTATYSEPGPRATIEFDFVPAVPARRKGHWYVVEQGEQGLVGGHTPVATYYGDGFPIPSDKILGHVSSGVTYSDDGKCYVAIINIDKNVMTGKFGEC